MASHCHHTHSHCPPPSSSSCTCCFNHRPPPPPPPPDHHQLPPDHLIQALSFLLVHQPQPHPNPTHASSLRWDPPQLATNPIPHHLNHQLLSSLARRITDLESALAPPSNARANRLRRASLREEAARVIQTRFRAFLVRRSRALRQLQELAYLKARFVSLRSSVSGRTQFDSKVVSRKAMDLLLGVDSIEGCDPMIRDGKRSITRDLVSFLDFVDGFTLRRRVEKSRAVGVRCQNVKQGGNRRENAEELRSRVEKIRGFSRACGDEENDAELEGFQQFIEHGVIDGRRVAPISRKMIVEKKDGVRPRSTKSVRFSENGNVCWVINDESEPILDADIRSADGSDDHGETVGKEFDIVEDSRGTTGGEEDEDEAQYENEGSSPSSDGERIPKGGLRGSSGSGSHRYFYGQDDLANTEQRTDLGKKRQGVKIIG